MSKSFLFLPTSSNSTIYMWDLWDLGVVRWYLVDRWPKTVCPWTRVRIVECTDFLWSQPAAQCGCSLNKTTVNKAVVPTLRIKFIFDVNYKAK